MKIGVATFVHGWYVDYIPIFIYNVLKSYPNYHVKIFVQGELPSYIKNSLDKIDSDNYEIVENTFNERKNDSPSKKPYYLRWLFPYEFLKEFDCTVICDVDLLMFKESPSLHERRLKICDKYKTPYANFLRSPHPDYPNRISGWHFIKTKEYYEKAEPIIQSMLNDKKFDISDPPSYIYGNGIGEKQWGQEALLYKIIKLSFGEENIIDERKEYYPYHHGLHLGPFRGELPERFEQKDQDAIRSIGRNVIYWNSAYEINAILKDEKFHEIKNDVKNEKVKHVLQHFIEYFSNKNFTIPML